MALLVVVVLVAERMLLNTPFTEEAIIIILLLLATLHNNIYSYIHIHGDAITVHYQYYSYWYYCTVQFFITISTPPLFTIIPLFNNKTNTATIHSKTSLPHKRPAMEIDCISDTDESPAVLAAAAAAGQQRRPQLVPSAVPVAQQTGVGREATSSSSSSFFRRKREVKSNNRKRNNNRSGGNSGDGGGSDRMLRGTYREEEKLVHKNFFQGMILYSLLEMT